MIPRSWLVRSLALAAALSMVTAQNAQNTENADNCPAELVSFEVITGELILFQTTVKMSVIIFVIRICVHCPSGHA